MSKAFVRESDFEEEPNVPRPVATLPPGAKNFLTPDGAQRLRDELARLVEVARPPLAEKHSDPDARRELQIIDQRIRHLRESLSSAEIVAPPQDSRDVVVHFGSTVTVREADGGEMRYRIVGVDETEHGQNWISWQSPLAKALLNARRDERVAFKTPAGMMSLQIVAIE